MNQRAKRTRGFKPSMTYALPKRDYLRALAATLLHIQTRGRFCALTKAETSAPLSSELSGRLVTGKELQETETSTTNVCFCKIRKVINGKKNKKWTSEMGVILIGRRYLHIGAADSQFSSVCVSHMALGNGAAPHPCHQIGTRGGGCTFAPLTICNGVN